MPPSFHAQPPHPIQPHHQQAYAAAAVAAANVQHTANQQTPYVFINQVTANVNVHHGPVPNGAQQPPSGSKDTGSNNGAGSGSNPPLHMQHQPTSLQNAHATGLHPIHMQSGQMGHSTGMVPQSMTQPPPLQTNVATSLAASGMSHPSGTTLMPQFMPNTFPVPHQMAHATIPYNTIPSRPGAVPPQQHHTGPPNPGNIVPMQQLQQIYGYPPFFFQPNVASQVPPYPGGPLHGIPQTQIPQMHQAQMAHMAQVQQAQMNVQPNVNQRQGIPQPIQSQPIILRNPMSPPAMPQGGTSINPSGAPMNQSHPKSVGGAGFVTSQRTAMQSNPTTAPLGVVPNSSLQAVPQHARQTQQQPSQLNPQAPFFPPQQTTKSPMLAPVVATTNPNNCYVAPIPNTDATRDKQAYTANTRVENSNEKEGMVMDGNISSGSHGTVDSTNVAGENTTKYESDVHQQPISSSNEEVSTQEEEEGLAFGTVDLKSLVAHGNVSAFVSDDTIGFEHLQDTHSAGQAQPPNREMEDKLNSSFEDKGEKEINIGVPTLAAEEEQKAIKEEEEIADMENDKSAPSDDASDLPSKAKSWASLFKSSNSGAGPISVPSSNDSVYLSEGKLTARIQPYKESLNEIQTSGASQASPSDEAFNGKDAEMGNFLKEYSLNFRAPSIKPRGLSNRSNWCFVNAILQALVACPPFYNLMKSLPKDLLVSSEQTNQSVKILRAVYHFFAEFSPLDNFPKLNRSKNKKNEDLPLGKMLEPTTIYNYLLELDSDTFKVIEGRQEDAEEFLTFLLNGLNDEMIALLKLVEQQERERSNER